jgi:hypothetical protein
MMPEPTTIASSIAVPTASADARFISVRLAWRISLAAALRADARGGEAPARRF